MLPPSSSFFCSASAFFFARVARPHETTTSRVIWFMKPLPRFLRHSGSSESISSVAEKNMACVIMTALVFAAEGVLALKDQFCPGKGNEKPHKYNSVPGREIGQKL